MGMPKKPRADEPTEKTPHGYTVPVPKRADVLANLKKLARVKSTPTGAQKQ